MTEQVITFEAMEQAANLFGSFDENIKLLERELSLIHISEPTRLASVSRMPSSA